MCRFVLYLGEEIPLDILLTRPSHSLIHQSYQSREREEPLNGDGFGLAAYVRGHEARPAHFRYVTPAWSNRNLLELARILRSGAVLAHVRAATDGIPVSELNCHPFVWGRLSFMHNGSVAGFGRIRRSLLGRLSDAAFDAVEGSTDSEHVFALAVDRYLAAGSPTGVAALADVLSGALADTESLLRAADIHEVSRLNVALCDGRSAVVARHTTGGPQTAHTLYVHQGGRYVCEGDAGRMVPGSDGERAVVVASEPLSPDPGWQPVPPNHLVLISETREVTLRPLA